MATSSLIYQNAAPDQSSRVCWIVNVVAKGRASRCAENMQPIAPLVKSGLRLPNNTDPDVKTGLSAFSGHAASQIP
jgi:hypothetical protein